MHLLAHSLDKAHSFLASGRAVKASAVGIFAQQRSPSGLLWALLTGGIAALVLLQAPGLVESNRVFGALPVHANFDVPLVAYAIALALMIGL